MSAEQSIELGDSRVARVSVRPFPDVDRLGELGWVELVVALGAFSGLLEELVRRAGWSTATAVSQPGGEVLWRRRVRGEAAAAEAPDTCIADRRTLAQVAAP